MVKKGNTTIPQVKIKWCGLPAESTTWEDYNIVKAQFTTAPAWRPDASQWEELSLLALGHFRSDDDRGGIFELTRCILVFAFYIHV